MNPEDIHRLSEKYLTEQDLEGLGTLYSADVMFIPKLSILINIL
jgi:hypothetical protein